MDTTVLQIPINRTLRDKALSATAKMGFSSLQEMVRVFLSQIVSGEVGIKFEPKTIRLSPDNDKRYLQMVEGVKRGKVKTKTFSEVNSLMEYLTK